MVDPEKNEVELEIGAFMTPHINRARIMLVVLGVLYVILGYLAYKEIAPWKEAADRWSRGGRDAEVEQLRSAIQIAYVVVVYVICAGLANILLAAIAGKKTMIAFNIAAVIFVVHTLLQIYATKGTIFFSWLWWASVIILGMGYQAAFKAYKLRQQAASGTPSL
jgi:hypothetical protein